MFHVKLPLFVKLVSRETYQIWLNTETETKYAMFHVKHGVLIYFFGIKG